MCGFIAFFEDQSNNEQHPIPIEKMNAIITHRGPDADGFYQDEHVSLGFRRLSIIDLESGNQPLSYHNQRYWIVFNGEIYNYLELKEELLIKGLSFSTNSDTEILLALYHVEKEAMLHKLRGMFAFVIYDREQKELFAARDHFGIKPFYYLIEADRCFFASEKKSILLAKEENQLNPYSLQHYFTYQYVPEPETLITNIKKLEPGHYLKKGVARSLEINCYFQPRFATEKRDFEINKQETLAVLRDSVKMHMRSDVPVGAFLSGGIDSTCIVALAKEVNPNIKTFTVGFERKGFSEIDLAKETATWLEVDNIHYVVSPREFLEELPKIVWHMDDPVADPAAIPLYFIAREARKHVTVVLSGEGADELFGGYNIYREPNSLKIFNYFPEFMKGFLHFITRLLPNNLKGKSFIERGTLPLEKRFYGNAKIYTEKEKQLLLKNYHPSHPYDVITQPLYAQMKGYDDITKMQAIDMQTWLRGDILVKADRMTMAHSLELRVPFLDKMVFETASKIETAHKISHGTTKYVLREAMGGIIPPQSLVRKKLGFPVPIRHWLKEELYDWAVQLLENSRADHLIDKGFVLQLLKKHKENKGDYSRRIWTVLIFLIWYEIVVENISPQTLSEQYSSCFSEDPSSSKTTAISSLADSKL